MYNFSFAVWESLFNFLKGFFRWGGGGVGEGGGVNANWEIVLFSAIGKKLLVGLPQRYITPCSLASSLETSKCHRGKVFYRCYFDRCLSQLAKLVPLPLLWREVYLLF